MALGKRRFKRIDQIRSGNRTLKKPRAIKIEILNFYKKLYKQEPKPKIHLDSSILPKISEVQLQSLEKRPSMEEISSALHDCDASKAPGYDGFNLKFVKSIWKDIKLEVCNFILDFFDSGKLPKEINRTWVTLILKIEDAVEVKDFRPISMIGCLYKIIAKILAKRLSIVLHDLIGETQYAFVKNRQILDGVLIANEVLWWIKKTKQKGAILKLDFQKAYDTVRWDFLEETMQGMGFGRKWISWIMECVKTTSLSILVNGSPTSPFQLQRGLRQGDPLSPLLFLLVAETFNRIVIRGRDLGILKGVAVGDKLIRVTHLQFADDTIIFSPANTKNLDNYKKFLKCFALMSGLKINYQKSALIPLNCDEKWAVEAMKYLGCGLEKLPFTYLGIPLGANPRKSCTWKPIIDKVEKRLAMWKARNLSRAGRLVLIKAVLNSLPVYYLSIFRIPKNVARRIAQIQRRFFWGKRDGDKGGNLIAWETIQKPIKHGGLGVGDIATRNSALLFKWWWRFADEQKPLWKEIVKSNHDIEYLGDFQKMDKKSLTSIWGQVTDFSNFNEVVQLIANSGILVKVGNGKCTSFWLDLWTGNESLKNRFPRLFLLSMQKESLIENMGEWEGEGWRWIFKWRRKLFAWEEDLVGDLLVVVNQSSLRANTRDVRLWSGDKSNIFSVSNFVLQVGQRMEKDSSPSYLGRLPWRNRAPPRAQLHLWFILQGRLNTKERLHRLNFAGIEDDRCALCMEEPETIDHLFFSCKISSRFWYYCCKQWNLSLCLPNDTRMCLLSWFGNPFKNFDKQLWISMFYVITWSIWDIRNKITFQAFKPNWEFEERRLFWRLGMWVKGWCPDFPFSPTQTMDNFSDIRGWKTPRYPSKGLVLELP